MASGVVGPSSSSSSPWLHRMIGFRIVHVGFRIGDVDIGLADSFKMQVAVAKMFELAETFDENASCGCKHV